MTDALLATDPVDRLLTFTADVRQSALDIGPGLVHPARLPELLDTVWELQGVLDELTASLLDRALPRQAVRLLLMRHWARDRQVRAATLPTGSSPHRERT